MFIVHTVHETILIQPSNLALSTAQAIHNEIDERYPNRILMDVGLVIARYGDTLQHVSHGVCVAGQGGAHHFCSFRLIVFRPFVEEVCLGKIHRSTEEGIYVTLGFFGDIFIPAYYMLRPSVHEKSSGLWVWTPEYGDDDDDDDDDDDGEDKKNQQKDKDGCVTKESETNDPGEEQEKQNENRYEMEIGSEIRFKVKSVHFARITNSAKGRQAFMSTTDKPSAAMGSTRGSSSGGDAANTATTTPTHSTPEGTLAQQLPVRKRSSSVGLDEDTEFPPAMHIIASICEDGLGLTSWWGGGGDEGVDDDEEDDAAYEEEQEEIEQADE